MNTIEQRDSERAQRLLEKQRVSPKSKTQEA